MGKRAKDTGTLAYTVHKDETGTLRITPMRQGRAACPDASADLAEGGEGFEQEIAE